MFMFTLGDNMGKYKFPIEIFPVFFIFWNCLKLKGFSQFHKDTYIDITSYVS